MKRKEVKEVRMKISECTVLVGGAGVLNGD